MTAQQVIQQAMRLHQSGRLGEAAAIYRQVLARIPEHPDALHLLGVVEFQSGNAAVALELIDKAILSNPNVADFYLNRGAVLAKLGRLTDAIASFEKAVDMRPNSAAAHANLGNALREAGEVERSIRACRKAIELDPNYRSGHTNLGLALQASNDLDGAVAAFGRAVELGPEIAESHCTLGNAFFAKGDFDQALASYQTMARLRPDLPQAHHNVGLTLAAKKQLVEAIPHFQRALSIQPDYLPSLSEMGAAMRLVGHPEQSAQTLERVVALDPNDSSAIGNLGNAYKDLGRLREAVACYERRMAAVPDDAVTDSNRVYSLLFEERCDSQALLREHRLWNQRHAAPLAGHIRKHERDRDPSRRLRIGYVSPDFRDHVVGLNILPLLRRHDRRQFEVFCFSNVDRPDSITDQFRACADGWRDIRRLSDEKAAKLIEDDQIDILVDLALHMQGHRLLLFARKPAPVQVTFAGYPGGTGLDAIDWRLTDPYLDPPGQTDADYVEKSYRLADSFWCYEPPTMTWDASLGGSGAPEPGPLPALRNGYVTFGSLNNFCKINESVLDQWSRVMGAVRNSRLVLSAPLGRGRETVHRHMETRGIDPARLRFEARLPRTSYFKLFTEIDLCLDTLPYNGHTTSLDSLWMGVPVVTRIGNTVVGRAGWSQLSNLGLTELAAKDDEQFVSIAVQWAGDPGRLGELRRTLRQRMEDSPLTDAGRFTRAVEKAYRGIWANWCLNP